MNHYNHYLLSDSNYTTCSLDSDYS